MAVSCTGTGEEFIRAVAAHEVAALIQHAGAGVTEAAATALADLHGGLIAVGGDGRIAMPFNTGLMYRGQAVGGRIRTAIWPGEEGDEGGTGG